MDTPRELSDRLAALLRRERSALAEFLVALSGFDARRAWAELGYASLFHYLHRESGMSKGSAQYRKPPVQLLNRRRRRLRPVPRTSRRSPRRFSGFMSR
jgi:hypothetical protein